MFEIVTTIGPKSLNLQTLKGLQKAGATSFRINLSHMNNKELTNYIEVFQTNQIPISLDTQGGQIRIVGNCANVNYLNLSEGDTVEFSNEAKVNFSLNQSEAFNQIEIDDIIKVDFDGLYLRVIDVDPTVPMLKAKALNNGVIKKNKAISVENKIINLPTFTEFDMYALNQAKAIDVKEIYLSFCNSVDDILNLKALLSRIYHDSAIPKVIAKIETQKGVLNIEDIVCNVDSILIDRGDLSSEVSISRVPMIVNQVLETCLDFNTPCLVATNVLDSMMSSNMPSRAEISDIYNLMKRGIAGFVLAAEVAIGENPIDSVKVIDYMNKIVKFETKGMLGSSLHKYETSTLPNHLKYWL